METKDRGVCTQTAGTAKGVSVYQSTKTFFYSTKYITYKVSSIYQMKAPGVLINFI